jgi:DNA-binding transcriptional MerR regulator
VTKTAPNAALYGDEHVERLKLIRRLRSDDLGPLSVSGVREVLNMVDRGVEAEVAAALYLLPGGFGKSGGASSGRAGRSLSDVAHQAGLSLSTARSLQESGLLPGRVGNGDSRVFDQADAVAARLIAQLLSYEGVRPSDLDPIAELVGELVRYERALVNLVSAKLESGESTERRQAMHHSFQALHTYLFSRLVPEPAEG